MLLYGYDTNIDPTVTIVTLSPVLAWGPLCSASKYHIPQILQQANWLLVNQVKCHSPL